MEKKTVKVTQNKTILMQWLKQNKNIISKLQKKANNLSPSFVALLKDYNLLQCYEKKCRE